MGTGRCKLHAGCAPGAPITTGRYSIKKRKALAAKVAKYANDPTALDLTEELGFLRALLQEHLDQMDTVDTPLTTKQSDILRGLIDDIGKAAARFARIRRDTAITAAEVIYVQARIADMMEEYVPRPRHAAFLRELERSFGAVARGTRADGDRDAGALDTPEGE